MKKIISTSILLCFAFISQVKAQTIQVTGKVSSSATNEPLQGVSVSAKGSSGGTSSDVLGNFKLNVLQSNSVLLISSVGYQPQEVALNGRTTVNINLVPTSQELSEVVVTGYGDRRRSAFTGSAVTVSADKIADKPFTSVDQALQGNVAGLQLTASSGTPGSVQDIRIRGISSITAGNQPLFVIDGVPVVSGQNQQESLYGNLSILSSLNSNDIESISVLKDASATALYGARGANGVIVITTKRGKSGKPIVSLSANGGSVQKASPGPKMLNAFQFAELYYEARVNAGQATSIDQAKTLFPLPWDGVTNTDWQDVATNHEAKTRSIDLSVRGGNAKSKYFSSISYLNQDGANVGIGYKRTTGKLNYETDISDKIKFTTSTLGSYIYQKGQLEAASFFGSPDAGALYLKPYDPVYNADGSYNLNLHSSYYHPLYIADNAVYYRKQVRGLVSPSLSYEIIRNLKFTSTLGLDYLNTEELYYDDRHHGDGAFVGGYSFMYYTRNFNYDWKNMIDYNWRIANDHTAAFKVVYEAQKNKYGTVATGGNNIAADGLIYPSSVGTITYASGYTNDWGINSVLGVVNYGFKNKFFVDGTLRREGNSRFAPEKRWGTFYSVGASYDLTKERAISNFSNWLNTARLRASYGKTGNAAIGINQYQAFLGYNGAYNSTAGIYPSQFGNTDLSWENNKTWNIGLDFGLFKRITGSVEYFRRNTYDLLLDVPLSSTSGFTSQTQNIGEMVNRGIEASLNADVFERGAFKWNIGVNLTSVHNQVTKLPTNSAGQEIGITNAWQTVTQGQPVFSWFLPTWAGVDPANGSPLWYKDGKGGETTSNFNLATKAVHGSPAPTLFGGLTNNFEYKGIFLNSTFYYAGGHYIFDRFAFHLRSDGRFNYTLSNGYADLLNRWQKPGDIAENPKNVYNNTSNSHQLSTRNLYKGDFVRLRDLTLGYNLPKSLLSKAHLSTVSIYARGNNIWTHTADDKLPFDPETRADGVLTLIAQPIKTYVIGVNITF